MDTNPSDLYQGLSEYNEANLRSFIFKIESAENEELKEMILETIDDLYSQRKSYLTKLKDNWGLPVEKVCLPMEDKFAKEKMKLLIKTHIPDKRFAAILYRQLLIEATNLDNIVNAPWPYSDMASSEE